MAQRMRKKVLREIISRESQKRIHLEQEFVYIKNTVESAMGAIETLRGYLIEAGILETNWKPEAPKGSSIKPNVKSFEPSYTKINKVWE